MSANFTLAQLASLEEAIAKGILIVKYSDKTVEYRSLNEMLKIRSLMRKCLGLESKKGGRLLTETDKGLGC